MLQCYVLFQDAFTRSKKDSDGKTFVAMQQNSKRVFSDAQELLIEEYAIKIAQMFYGLTTVSFRKLVLKYAEVCGSKTIPDRWGRDGMATLDWYKAYMDRHPKLSLKSPEGMSLARAKAFNRVNVGQFFDAYTDAVVRYSFAPDRIFNLDESGLSTVMKPLKVVCERGCPVASRITQERGSHMTFVSIINAAGHYLPPVFIVARKKMNPAFLRGTMHGTTVLLQSNGWMDHERFVETLKHLHERSYSSLENKIMLIMDNAECHMSIHAVEYAIQHGIVIVTLPPHTTAKLQPLDVSVFGPFKTRLRQKQDDFLISNVHCPITEHVLPEMACRAWIEACTPTTVLKGFEATGIWPINRNIFSDEVFAGAEVSEQDLPSEQDLEVQDLRSSSVTPSSSGYLSPDYLPDHEQQPGPSGIGQLTPSPAASVPATPEPPTSGPEPPTSGPTPAPSVPATPATPVSPTASSVPATPATPVTPVSPTAVQPYPKATPRPIKAGRGRAKIRTCVLTENEEAKGQLKDKEQRKQQREEKKKIQEEKKKEREKKRKEQELAGKNKRRKVAEESDSTDEEDVDGAVVPLSAMVDDSSEYSDELPEYVEMEGSYPFAQEQQPKVRNLA